MKQTLTWIAKAIAVWLAILIGQALGGMLALALTHVTVPTARDDGPFNLTMAMIVIAALFALIVAGLASRMRWGFWGKAAALFVLIYGLDSVLSQIESVFFNSFLHLSQALMIMIGLSNAIKAAVAALVAAALWRKPLEAPAERFGGLYWKIPVISPLYIVCYFGAGALIAWKSAAVRAYYGQGFHIDNGQLILLQAGRGLIWALLAFLSVKSLTGSKLSRASLTGAAFSVLMAATLLMPNVLMPWAVRKMHLLEISSSNFLFGVLASLILLVGVKASPSGEDRP